MAFLIAIDDGHGQDTKGKRTPNIPGIGVIKENTFNRAVANFLDQELRRLGFRTLLVAPTDADTPLATRTNLANARKANIYVSIHYNAGGGSGIETYYYNGSANGKRLAKAIHQNVIQGTKQIDRGIKSGNHLWVIRKTTMPAVLIEYGFMDDPGLIEARRMIDENFQRECAIETAKGICEYFKVPYYPKGQPPKWNRYLQLTSPMMKGDDIRLVQLKLGISVDGIFGPKTKAAVINFQRAKGLAVDGIVGPKTWAKLFE